MASSNSLTRFVHDALSAGRARQDIADALAAAGWPESEIERALADYSEIEFNPPVPRPRPQLTARDVFVYALLFTALTSTAVHLVQLIHAILDLWLPDPADNQYFAQRATRNLRWAIAFLVVFTPLFAWMTLFAEREQKRDVGHSRSLVRKWLTYLALFVSALTFCGDFVYVVYHFLAGEMTLRFILKAVAVAGVSGAIFFFYLRDVEVRGNGR